MNDRADFISLNDGDGVYLLASRNGEAVRYDLTRRQLMNLLQQALNAASKVIENDHKP